jgi:hypothetical protein
VRDQHAAALRLRDGVRPVQALAPGRALHQSLRSQLLALP